jgi:XTP/dITP diphosphohydrolase
VSADIDAESSLRTAVLEFVDTVRGVEKVIAATRRGDSVPEEFDVAPLGEITEQEWREHWPSAGSAAGDEAEDNGDKGDDEPAAASKGSGRGSKKRGGRR